MSLFGIFVVESFLFQFLRLGSSIIILSDNHDAHPDGILLPPLS